MSQIRGTVEDLVVSRELGRFLLRRNEPGFLATMILYKDTGVDMIDPTEMVRRNWMIGVLQQSLTRGFEVTVVAHKLKVQSVTLHTTTTKKLPSGGNTTKGLVKKIRILHKKGLVTIYGATTAALEQSPGRRKPKNRDFVIYTDELGGAVPREESDRRNRTIGLLRQALADGLQISVTHAPKPATPLIVTANLHAKA